MFITTNNESRLTVNAEMQIRNTEYTNVAVTETQIRNSGKARVAAKEIQRLLQKKYKLEIQRLLQK